MELNIKEYNWPLIDKTFLEEEYVKIVVQINGKKRGIFTAKKDISEDNLANEIKISKNFDKFLKDIKVKRQIYVTNRLINFII